MRREVKRHHHHIFLFLLILNTEVRRVQLWSETLHAVDMLRLAGHELREVVQPKS